MKPTNRLRLALGALALIGIAMIAGQDMTRQHRADRHEAAIESVRASQSRLDALQRRLDEHLHPTVDEAVKP